MIKDLQFQVEKQFFFFLKCLHQHFTDGFLLSLHLAAHTSISQRERDRRKKVASPLVCLYGDSSKRLMAQQE